ncbi:MAG: hypothetical protein ACXAAH_09990, partial [Promethearchaeota archaeon]
MENLFESSLIKGFIFSAYGELGPQPVYTWPNYFSEKELKLIKKEDQKTLVLSLRDVTQISIKNLSLFISDREFSQDKEFKNLRYFAILPYPDFKATSLTYFHYIENNSFEQPVATAFSILVDENSRSFLYNNINRIKPIVSDFFNKFDLKMQENYPPQETVETFFIDLFNMLNEVERNPSTPITSHRKLKL